MSSIAINLKQSQWLLVTRLLKSLKAVPNLAEPNAYYLMTDNKQIKNNDFSKEDIDRLRIIYHSIDESLNQLNLFDNQK